MVMVVVIRVSYVMIMLWICCSFVRRILWLMSKLAATRIRIHMEHTHKTTSYKDIHKYSMVTYRYPTASTATFSSLLLIDSQAFVNDDWYWDSKTT
jgi:hypothetical protein